MSIQFQPAALAGAIAIALGFSATTQADDQTAAKASLDTLVVTASRSEQHIKNVPAQITVIDQKTIASNPILNISELIQRDPSVYIKQSGGFGQVSEIRLRGTNAVHTLVLKDGARLNSQNNYGPLYPSFLDTTDVQQVEILKGPASVQYGSDAIGGVVQLLSKKPEQSGAELTGIYGENKTYKSIAKANLVANNGFYTQISGQRLETDGTRIYEGRPSTERGAFDQKGYNAKVGYSQDNLVDASISISENKGISIFSYDYETTASPREFENRIINTKLSYHLLPNLVIGSHLANVKDKQNVIDYGDHYDTENNEADLNLKWNFTEHQNILVGATYNDANYKTNSILENDQSVESKGYYAQHQFTNNLLDTQVGVRLEDNKRFGTHTVGQGAIRYHFLPSASIYANIGTAFRAPSLNELYTKWGGNSDLAPEKSTSYELGLDYNLTENLSTQISAYHTKIKDLISYGESKNENITVAKINGGEASIKWAQGDFFVSTAYAYAKTENKENGKELAYRPKETLTLTAGLEKDKYGISTSLIARSKSYINNSNSEQISGYATVDLNAYWNINPQVKLFTNIQNIGDVEYRTEWHSSNKDWYINGGRLASAGVTFKY
ncbi:TonB-dependent receptor [Acinetobacter sp. ANC 4862]|uniref:TonB-dependent receptor plug domain-containing protein n=1 Tax=Acinetobacter sp. ANC 4862 TaxID=2529849 RepID=UPI002076E0E3|nr:TonB-dependent receptor [Acinetobacter sp. ANC 4862]